MELALAFWMVGSALVSAITSVSLLSTFATYREKPDSGTHQVLAAIFTYYFAAATVVGAGVAGYLFVGG